MVQLIKSLKIKNIILAGESIGGVLPVTISLIIPKLIKIILFNPYDYDTYFGEGIGRGNFCKIYNVSHWSTCSGKLFCGSRK